MIAAVFAIILQQVAPNSAVSSVPGTTDHPACR
jgi:hypothetical protein